MDFLNWLAGASNDVFGGSALPNGGRDLSNVPIFGGDSGDGGLLSAFTGQGSGLMKLISQINGIATVIGILLLFLSLFLCIQGFVQATINADPGGIAEARQGISTCLISIACLNMLSVITGIIMQLAKN